jgi:hypothetical protein
MEFQRCLALLHQYSSSNYTFLTEENNDINSNALLKKSHAKHLLYKRRTYLNKNKMIPPFNLRIR